MAFWVRAACCAGCCAGAAVSSACTVEDHDACSEEVHCLNHPDSFSVLTQAAAVQTFLLHAQLHALCVHECTGQKASADTGRLAPVSLSADRSFAHHRLNTANIGVMTREQMQPVWQMACAATHAHMILHVCWAKWLTQCACGSDRGHHMPGSACACDKALHTRSANCPGKPATP